MSVLTSYASASARDSAAPASSNTGLCIFRSDSNAIEVSDGTDWQTYNSDGVFAPGSANNSYHLSLDGTDDHAEVSGSSEIQISYPLTISAWIYPTSNASALDWRTIISWGSSATGQGRFLSLSGTNNLTFGTYQSSVISSTSLSLNTWYHVAATVDTGSTKLYVNGSLDTTGSNTLNSFTYGKTHVGELYYSQTTAGRHFAGNIDELALFNSVLSASEINQVYHSRNVLNLNFNYNNYTSSSNLKAWWRMGDGTEAGSGTTIYDMSDSDSNSDNLTLVNQASISSTGPIS